MLGGGRAYEEGGVKVADPLEYLNRVNGEASYNVDLIYTETTKINAAEDILWEHLSMHLTNIDTTHVVNKIGKKAAGHYMAILGHDIDENGFTPVCGERVEFSSLTPDTNIAGCDQLKELKVSSPSKITVGAFAARNADKLEKTILNSQTYQYEVEEMAFRGNYQQGHTIVFESDRYTAGANSNFNVVLDPSSYDATTRCAISCADNYFDNSTTYAYSGGSSSEIDGRRYKAPLCSDSANLNDRYCELDKLDYRQQFMSRQIVHDTHIECPDLQFNKNTASASNLETMEFYLGTGCGQLTFGDLTKCTALKYIYLHQDIDYATSGANVAATCAKKLDFTGAKFPANLKFVWSNDEPTINDARKKIDDMNVYFGVAATIKNFDGSDVMTAGEMCAKKFDANATSGYGPATTGVNTLADIQNTAFASLQFATQPKAVNATCTNANGTSVTGFNVTDISSTACLNLLPLNTEIQATNGSLATCKDSVGVLYNATTNATCLAGNATNSWASAVAATSFKCRNINGAPVTAVNSSVCRLPANRLPNSFTAYKPAYSSLLTHELTAATSGDQTYLVGGAFSSGRFGVECPHVRDLVLPDSVLSLSDSAVLDLQLE